MNKKAQIKAVKGMNDTLPGESSLWLEVEAICVQVFRAYSYAQIRTPIIEKTGLFLRSIGSDTDIVSKEMYSFEDRNGDSLTLRPEGTASTVRAGIEKGLFYNQLQRLWYIGPMFRYERPQKGRYRQFHQVGAECYGWSTPDIEAELLSMLKQLFDRLGLRHTELQINSLGDADTRTRYRAELVSYLSAHKAVLDEDSQRRLASNPLRILDSKNADVQRILDDAPNILDFLTEESDQRFTQLQDYLAALGVAFTVNPRLVRGLDYYNDTVFEWVNEGFGAQSAVCGGGRYDNMVEQLGGQATPAFGFGMGLERLVQILQEQQADLSKQSNTPDVFLVSIGQTARRQALVLQQAMTAADVSVMCHMGEGSMKNQFKRADKSGALIALIIGEQESIEGNADIKPLRHVEGLDSAQSAQQTISQNDVVNVVTNLLESL